MAFAEVILIALGLAMDAFAVSLGAATTRYITGPRPIFRLAFHFGLFQALMPVLGWLAGSTVQQYIAAFDHWIALGLLALIGSRMVKSGFDRSEAPLTSDPSRGITLILLAVATSIDAFAVGLSLAMLNVSILSPAVIIGLVAGALSLAGVFLGQRLGEAFGKRMEVVGGLILIGIGLRVVLVHTDFLAVIMARVAS